MCIEKKAKNNKIFCSAAHSTKPPLKKAEVLSGGSRRRAESDPVKSVLNWAVRHISRLIIIYIISSSMQSDNVVVDSTDCGWLLFGLSKGINL